MTAKIINILPRVKGDIKKEIPASDYIARIVRLELLIKEACQCLEFHNVELWPTPLSEWWDKFQGPLTFDEAIEQLTDEQYQALGYNDETDN